MGVCAPELKQSKQIDKDNGSDAANRPKPTGRSGMRFKPVDRCRQQARGPRYPTGPVHVLNLAPELSNGHRLGTRGGLSSSIRSVSSFFKPALFKVVAAWSFNEVAGRSMIARRLRHARSGRGAMSGPMTLAPSRTVATKLTY